MQAITGTRIELLARRTQLELAQQGFDLLEQKRTALMQELLRMVDRVIEQMHNLEEALNQARRAQGRAETLAGPAAVMNASLAVRDEFALHIETVKLMGVEVPNIEQRRVRRSMLGRGYSITGASPAIDEAALAFEDAVETIIKQAESELRLKRLVDEIQRTSRRLNSLEHILIPRLQLEIDYIEMSLNEQERADHFRFRLAKRLLARKAGRA